jgi:hypothetical protein
MTRKMIFTILAAAAVSTLLIIWGCGSDDKDPTGNDPVTETDDMVMPQENQAAINDAVARYEDLRTSQDPAAARTVLVQEINSDWPNVDTAALLSDGVSIQIEFDDGSVAILITDEAIDVQKKALKTAAGNASDIEVIKPEDLPKLIASVMSSTGNKTDPGCDDITVPTSQKVHIVNLAGASRTYTQDEAAATRQMFIDMGWDPDDVKLSQITAQDDYNLTPHEIFDQKGYGIVLFVGNGGHSEIDGQQYSIFEFWNGGTYEDFQDQVTQEQWQEYQSWDEAEQIVPIAFSATEYTSEVTGWAARGDFFCEKLQIDPGTMVNFIGAYGAEMEAGVLDAGAGMVTAWDGLCPLARGFDAFERLMDNLAGGDDGLNAFSEVYNSPDGKYDGEFGTGKIDTGVSAAINFHIPAQLDFEAPDACAEPGTSYYDVAITYADCPDQNQSFQFFRGADFSLKGLSPYGAEMSLTAKDASGNTLGAANQTLELTGGPNEIDLCPCEGVMTASLDNIPEDAATLSMTIDYNDPTVPSETVSQALPLTVFDDLLALDAAVLFEVYDSMGGSMGSYQAEQVRIGCDLTLAWGCFGWLEIPTNNLPDGTASVDISTDHPGVLNGSFTLSPGETGEMYGFQLGDQPIITAMANDATGELLSLSSEFGLITCGANQIVFDFETYGIILKLNTDHAAITGTDFVYCWAEVRWWQSFDTIEPTGDPVPNRTVLFTSTHGEFYEFPDDPDGPEKDMTNDNGIALVHLSSTETGLATVQAFITSMSVESDPVDVEFRAPVKVLHIQSSEPYDGEFPIDDPDYSMVDACLRYELFNNDLSIYSEEYTTGTTHFNMWVAFLPGDTLRFEWTPLSGCEDSPYHSGSWIHIFRGDNYGQQINLPVSYFQDPLMGIISKTIILPDPNE